jgi:DNA-binding CsgD family transcriptional regulator
MNTTDDVVDKLDVLIRLMAMGLCADKSQKEKIQILDSAGLPPKQIAEMLGTTPNTVSVALVGLRKERKKVPQARKAKPMEALDDQQPN